MAKLARIKEPLGTVSDPPIGAEPFIIANCESLILAEPNSTGSVKLHEGNPMLHLYSAALFAVIATNVVIIVLIAIGIKRVTESGAASLRQKSKKRGILARIPPLSTRRLRQSGIV
jgi:hypothetical protein